MRMFGYCLGRLLTDCTEKRQPLGAQLWKNPSNLEHCAMQISWDFKTAPWKILETICIFGLNMLNGIHFHKRKIYRKVSCISAWRPESCGRGNRWRTAALGKKICRWHERQRLAADVSSCGFEMGWMGTKQTATLALHCDPSGSCSLFWWKTAGEVLNVEKHQIWIDIPRHTLHVDVWEVPQNSQAGAGKNSLRDRSM